MAEDTDELQSSFVSKVSCVSLRFT